MKSMIAIFSIMSISSTVFASNLIIAQKIINNKDVLAEASYKASASDFHSIEVVSKGGHFEAIVKFTSLENICSVTLKGNIAKDSVVTVKSISDGDCGQ